MFLSTCQVRVQLLSELLPPCPSSSLSFRLLLLLTANSRSQCALPELIRELQMSVGTAGPQPDAREYVRQNQNARKNVRCQIDCQKECQRECQTRCQKKCQTECLKRCQIECQKGCQIECQQECQKVCQNRVSDRMPENNVRTCQNIYAIYTSKGDLKNYDKIFFTVGITRGKKYIFLLQDFIPQKTSKVGSSGDSSWDTCRIQLTNSMR